MMNGLIGEISVVLAESARLDVLLSIRWIPSSTAHRVNDASLGLSQLARYRPWVQTRFLGSSVSQAACVFGGGGLSSSRSAKRDPALSDGS